MSDLNTKNFIKAEQLLRKAVIKNNTAEFNYILGNTLKIQELEESLHSTLDIVLHLASSVGARK